MALLKQCFCYSLRQGSFIIGSYSLVVYCVAFAVELWWIVESLLILPAPAYTLCALYFFDFIMAAILLFGLLVRQRKYLMSWTLMTVLSFFPEAGMVLFMSLYYWPAHKFEYGVIELVYWSLRAIFNIFGAVCVCSLYLTWRDEELILGRLHDLTLANVETGSTGVGVLRSGNFTGTLKGNNNLAYQNYAYVDSSAGLPDNLNYKNSNAFHSKRGYGYYSPSTLHSFYTTVEHTPTTQPSSSSSVQKTKKHFYYCCKHHSFFQRCCVVGGDGAPCQQHSPKLFPLFPLNCFDEEKSERKTISSLPILWTESPSKLACCCDLANHHQYFYETPVSGGGVKCGCSKTKFNAGLCSSCGDGAIGRNTYLFCSINQAANPRSYYETLSKLPSAFHDDDEYDDDQQGPSTLISRSEKNVNLDKTVLTATVASKLQTSEPHNINKTGAKVNGLRPKFLKRRQSCQSSSSESGVGIPKIEIVICTEVHGSIETKIIRRPDTSHRTSHKHLQQGKVINIPFSHFRRALSDYPRTTAKMMEPENDDDSSVHTLPFEGSIDSTSSIIVVKETDKKKDRKGSAGNRNKSGHKCKHGFGKGEERRQGFKLFHYISHITTCCVSRSASSLLSPSCSGDLNDDEIDDISGGGGGSLSYNRGLSNTRSFTMHNSDHHLGGNRGATLAMKSEFNPAMLFDPAYRKSRISELGIAGIGLEPPGQLPMGTFNRMNRSRSLWNVSNEDYWNRPPPSRPVSLGYVNHIHQLEQMAGHKDCCVSMNNNSNATMNLNKQMMMKGGFGGMGALCSQQSGYRNPIHGSVTSVSTGNHHHPMGGMGGGMPASMGGGMPASMGGHLDSCGVHRGERESDHRRNWLATGRRAQSVDGLNHFYHRYYGKNIAAHHNLHPSGLIHGDHHSQDWSKSSLCPDEPSDDCRNYHDIAL